MGRWDPATAANQAAGNNFGYGYLWVGGVSWNDLPVWAHELGHNVSRRGGGVKDIRLSLGGRRQLE